MAVASTRARALSLYRRLLRSARTWPGPLEEKQYIRAETRTLFRQNQSISEAAEINKKLFEGETRLELAWHYLIPYPRPHNLPPGTVAGSKIQLPSAEMGKLGEEEEEDSPVLRAKQRIRPKR